MKVSLHLETYKDTYNFLQINKKCLETTIALKRNPFYIDSTSIESFLNHFQIDTIYQLTITLHSLNYLSTITYIRYPIISPTLPWTKETMTLLFPKIQAITLYGDEFGFACIDNAKLFIQLDEIEGDCDMILQFLKKYSNDGKEYVNFPRKYLLKEYRGSNICLSKDELTVLKELRKLIPNTDMISIQVFLDEGFHSRKHIKLMKGLEWFIQSIDEKND